MAGWVGGEYDGWASASGTERTERKMRALGTPNGWRQWRAQRVHCTPGLGSTIDELWAEAEARDGARDLRPGRCE